MWTTKNPFSQILMKKENGLSNCSEITIAKISIQNLSDFCNCKNEEFLI